MASFKTRLKWLLFPGLNLHARLRRKVIPRYFVPAVSGRGVVVDAGCGNGMLAYESMKRGNSVTGISIKQREIEGGKALFNDYLGVPEDRMTFKEHNLYNIDELGMTVDEIICTEVMEHIEEDTKVCTLFFNMLKPGGSLHICCPNAQHPDNIESDIDEHETGGHVRDGYTLETYKALLEPIGFEVVQSRGLGGPIRQFFNKRIIRSEERAGKWLAVPFFVMGMLTAWMDPPEPEIPYSLYVRAEKPADSKAGN